MQLQVPTIWHPAKFSFWGMQKQTMGHNGLKIKLSDHEYFSKDDVMEHCYNLLGI